MCRSVPLLKSLSFRRRSNSMLKSKSFKASWKLSITGLTWSNVTLWLIRFTTFTLKWMSWSDSNRRYLPRKTYCMDSNPILALYKWLCDSLIRTMKCGPGSTTLWLKRIIGLNLSCTRLMLTKWPSFTKNPWDHCKSCKKILTKTNMFKVCWRPCRRKLKKSRSGSQR